MALSLKRRGILDLRKLCTGPATQLASLRSFLTARNLSSRAVCMATPSACCPTCPVSPADTETAPGGPARPSLCAVYTATWQDPDEPIYTHLYLFIPDFYTRIGAQHAHNDNHLPSL